MTQTAVIRVLRPISHPQAKHPDGCIRPERDGENIVVNLVHHADNEDKLCFWWISSRRLNILDQPKANPILVKEPLHG